MLQGLAGMISRFYRNHFFGRFEVRYLFTGFSLFIQPQFPQLFVVQLHSLDRWQFPMTNLDSLYAKKYVVMPAVRTSHRKILIFELINRSNVPPYCRNASTFLTLAASEGKKEARHIVTIVC